MAARKARKISIHALREEGDNRARGTHLLEPIFLSTPSARRATTKIVECALDCRKFLSTPSARRATSQLSMRAPCISISIHALREEGDACSITLLPAGNYFYPRPPRGGRPWMFGRSAIAGIFLSTPSARRATAKTETKSLFSYKLYNILHEFRRALIYNGSKNYPNHAK